MLSWLHMHMHLHLFQNDQLLFQNCLLCDLRSATYGDYPDANFTHNQPRSFRLRAKFLLLHRWARRLFEFLRRVELTPKDS